MIEILRYYITIFFLKIKGLSFLVFNYLRKFFIVFILLILFLLKFWSNIQIKFFILYLFKDELAKNPNGVNLSAEQLLDYTIQGLKMYSVLLIVLVVVALLASFLMKKRILSGILFLLLAIVVAVGTVGVLIPVYLLYFIVAIILIKTTYPTEVFFQSFYNKRIKEQYQLHLLP